jgi:uncharacterized membrane protein
VPGFPAPDFNLTLKRNCSMSPQALLRLLGALAFFSVGIGVGFALAGAWLVLPFAGVEALALAAAFHLCCRHAGDLERIRILGGCVLVEMRDGEAHRSCELERAWVRIAERETGGEYRLTLSARNTEVEIGRHLDHARKRELAAALRRALR